MPIFSHWQSTTNPPTWLTAAPLGPYSNYTMFGNGTGMLGLAELKNN